MSPFTTSSPLLCQLASYLLAVSPALAPLASAPQVFTPPGSSVRRMPAAR
jgi:hypothetical protein